GPAGPAGPASRYQCFEWLPQARPSKAPGFFAVAQLLPSGRLAVSRSNGSRQWYTHDESEVQDDRFIRFDLSSVFNTIISSHIQLPTAYYWLSEANYIFSRLHITSSYEDYFVTQGFHFQLVISTPTENPPKGYLFLCPVKAIRTGPNSFRWPECPAYWSLDPAGAQHLSTDDATRLGFPAIALSTKISGFRADASVYAGIRKFHEAKGFDPDTQDVARHLGRPLYQISCEMEVPFAISA
ncbi:hypothetical protein DFH07DRAFT_444862, partial [Mycena maculata]